MQGYLRQEVKWTHQWFQYSYEVYFARIAQRILFLELEYTSDPMVERETHLYQPVVSWY